MITTFSITALTSATGWLVSTIITKALFYPRKPISLGITSIQGVVPKYYDRMKEEVAAAVEQKMLSSGDFFDSDSSFQMNESLDGVINEMLDDFISSIREEMPTLTMFINQSIEYTIKDVAKRELVKKFPDIMKRLTPELLKGDAIRKMIEKVFSGITLDQIETAIQRKFAREFRAIKCIGFSVGLVVGIAEFAILYQFRK